MALFHGEFGKQIQPLIDELGGVAESSGSGHIKVTFQNGNHTICPSTPSDKRAILNARRDLEEAAGKKVERRKTGKFHFKRTSQFAKTNHTDESDEARKCRGLMMTLSAIDVTLQDALDNPRKYSETQIEKILYDRAGIANYLINHGRDVDPHFKEKINRPPKESA